MGSIPLPALAIKQPDMGDTLNKLALIRQMQQQRALMPGQIQAQQQQLEAGALENQQRQQALRDQQATTAAMQEWDGKDINDLPGLVLKHGASAQAVLGLKTNIIKQQQDLANLSKDQLSNAATVNDQLLGHIDTLKGVTDPVQRAEAAKMQGAQILNSPIAKMLDPQTAQMVQGMAQGQFVPNDDQLNLFEKGLTARSVQIKNATSAAEQYKNTQQGDQAAQNAAKLKLEMQYYQQHGLAPGVPLDVQEAQDWLSKNPGKGPADFLKYKSTLVPAFNFNLQNSGTTGNAADVAKRFGMSPVAFDQAAEKYWTSGQLPPTGRGGPALALNKALMNRAGELHPEGSLAGNAAAYAANKQSLASIQKQFDQVTAFENTAGKNLDVFLNTAGKVIDSGSPWVNTPLRKVEFKGLGDADMAAFNAARTTALTEIAKVLNSSNASGVLSDSARHEVEGLIGPGASLNQIYRAANVLKQDMANRHESYQEQITDIKGRMGPQQQQSAPQQTAQPQAGGIPAGATGKAMGSDKQWHYHDAKGNDLGVAPNP